MSSSVPSGYCHPETGIMLPGPGMQLGVGDPYSLRGVVSAQLWTVPHRDSDGPSPSTMTEGTSRIYRNHHAMYVSPTGGLVRCPEHEHAAGVADPSSPIRPPHASTLNQLYPVAGRLLTGHGARPSHDAPNAYGAFSKQQQQHGQHTHTHTTPPETKAAPSALGFTPTSQTWEERVSTGFVSQASPLRLYPSQLHTRAPHRDLTHRHQPHALNPQSTHNEEDFYAFRCEWTDERGGVCNMQIAGDRVSMSHHLSRQHDVTGDEKSQRLCLWRGCTETMNKGSLARHVVSRHLRAGASCGFCSKVYSRADVARRHTKKCKAANGNATVGDKDDVMG